MSEESFHLKYRPKTLDRIIGNERAVTRLQGIIRTKRIPNAILFAGPSSAGKTTLARAFVATLFGTDRIDGHMDYHELNAGETRGIDDIRQLVTQSKLMPRVAPRRVLMIDEAQGLTQQAAQCFGPRTRVKTNKGMLTIKEVVDRSLTHSFEDFFVESYDHDTGTVEFQKVLDVRVIDTIATRKAVTVGLPNISAKDYVICTADHRIYSASLEEYVKAEEFRGHEALSHVDGVGTNLEVLVTGSATPSQVYDLQVQKNQNFFVYLNDTTPILVHNCLLKPVENPPPKTLYIFGSMEPEKLHQALKNRCSQFVLEPYSKEHICKYIKRIVKREQLEYVTDKIIQRVADNSNGELRSAAGVLESVVQYAAGSGKKKLSEEDVQEAMYNAEAADAAIAVSIIASIYANKFKQAQRALLDCVDPFRLIGTLLNINGFLMNSTVLGSDTHKAVWYSSQNKDAKDAVAKFSKIDPKNMLAAYATVQNELVNLRVQSGGFMIGERELVSAGVWAAITALRPLYKEKE